MNKTLTVTALTHTRFVYVIVVMKSDDVISVYCRDKKYYGGNKNVMS